MVLWYLVSLAATTIIGQMALSSKLQRRWLYLCPISCAASSSIYFALDSLSVPGYNGILSITALLCYFHILSLVYIENHQLSNQNSSPWSATWKVLYRRGSPKRHSKTKHGPSTDVSKEMEIGIPVIKQRWQFVYSGALHLLGMYVAMVVYYDIFNVPSYFEVKETDMFLEATVFFRRFPYITSTDIPITKREVILRACMVFSSTFEEYMQLTGIYLLLSLAFVGLYIDAPEDWPGLYGNILDATSMRSFWSKFDHRLAYRPLSSFSALIVDNIFWSLPKSSKARRYAVNVTVFLLSGAMHVFLEVLHGSCGLRYTMFWFFIQPLAFIIEEAVQWTELQHRIGKKISKKVGYCWIFMWLFWSIPKRAYPKMTCADAAGGFCINRDLGSPWDIWYHAW